VGLEHLPPASALAAADELAGILDEAAQAEAVDWQKLQDFVVDKDLAAHWGLSLEFLKIVTEHWPAFLKEQDALDQLTRRRQAAEALAKHWTTTKPEHPVLIIGSTGAPESVRVLMKAVLTLPRGAVVIPGFDMDLDAAAWRIIAETPSHPQHTPFCTLKRLGLGPEDVRLWPGSKEERHQADRRRLIHESLAPAQSTRSWNDRLNALALPDSAEQLMVRGLEGLSLVEAEDEGEEALAAALLLRETLETPKATAALITPDPSLGRRVSSILRRWNIELAPEAGVPLPRTPSGSFLLMALRWMTDPADPVLLLALLKHEYMSLGRPRDVLLKETSELELLGLRGPRRDQTLADLNARLEREIARTKRAIEKETDAEKKARAIDTFEALGRARELVADLAARLAGFAPPTEGLAGRADAEAAVALARALAASEDDPDGDRIWTGSDGAAAARCLEELADLLDEMGGVEREAWPDFADALAESCIAPPEGGEHPRIVIWGPLEARLQRRDRMILAGLNEGLWPKQPRADAFLNRALRKQMGLSDPDQLIGLAAHDFAQMANAPEVILLRAKRVDDKPSVASRWVWRLRTLAAGGFQDHARAEAVLRPAPERDPLQWARALRHFEGAKAVEAPSPRPKREHRRLNDMSPSRATTLIRDPYADFGRRVLKLPKHRPVGDPIDARERGTAVHAAIEHHMKDQGLSLDQLITDALVSAGASRDLIELERPLWIRAANRYLAWLDARAPRVRQVRIEVKGEHRVDSLAGPVVLRATADRIEFLDDGTLAIIDFKTGVPKNKKQVQSGLEPQLALEAAIAAKAGFGDLKAATVSELIYFQFSTSKAVMKEKNGQPLAFDDATTQDVANASLAGLERLIAEFSKEETPYLSKPRAQFLWKYDDYDRLARRAEWTAEGGEE
jgi:ATP-dependent helicase/nuclease subunit B